MPGYMLNKGAVVQCPHQAPAQIVPSNSTVLASGQSIALLSDQCLVSGCPLHNAAGLSTPCLNIQWVTASTRVTIKGQPVLLMDSSGISISPLAGPQGPPVIMSTQTRVKAT